MTSNPNRKSQRLPPGFPERLTLGYCAESIHVPLRCLDQTAFLEKSKTRSFWSTVAIADECNMNYLTMITEKPSTQAAQDPVTPHMV